MRWQRGTAARDGGGAKLIQDEQRKRTREWRAGTWESLSDPVFCRKLVAKSNLVELPRCPCRPKVKAHALLLYAAHKQSIWRTLGFSHLVPSMKLLLLQPHRRRDEGATKDFEASTAMRRRLELYEHGANENGRGTTGRNRRGEAVQVVHGAREKDLDTSQLVLHLDIAYLAKTQSRSSAQESCHQHKTPSQHRRTEVEVNYIAKLGPSETQRYVHSQHKSPPLSSLPQSAVSLESSSINSKLFPH